MYSQNYLKKQAQGSSQNKLAQKQLNDSFSKPSRQSDRQKLNEVSQIYNMRTRNPREVNLGSNPFQDESQIKIKVFSTSTKSNLDKKSPSAQHKQPSLQSRLFSNLDTDLNGSFTKMNTSTLIESERLTQCSPKSARPELIQLRLHKPIDHRFLAFIREYGTIVREVHEVPGSFTASSERSRMPSNENR